MCEFNKKDVLALANSVIKFALEYNDSDNYWGWECRFCMGHVARGYNHMPEDFPREQNCDVLIAKDILTGAN